MSGALRVGRARQRRWLQPLVVAAFLLSISAPAAASGMSMQFVTYDGFQETMDAFTRLALIFSDHVFLGFFSIFACGTVVAGLMVKSTQMQMGQESNPIGWLIPILAGGVIVQGLVFPTGTMYVYDPVMNATGSIGGVPDIVLIVAGGLNELEQDIVQVVDTASGTSYGTTGGTMPFTLLHSANASTTSEPNLTRSISQYFADCGTFAINNNQGKGVGAATLNELVNSSTDLYGTFAKFQSNAVQTVYYPISTDASYPADNGVPMSCTDAWASLGPNLASLASFKTMESTICANAGFKTTDNAQMTQCDVDLSNLVSSTLGVSSGNSLSFMRSILMANSIVTALQSGDFNMSQSQIMNRQIMTESLGSAQAMAEWIPKIRAFLTAAILGMFPLLALFMVTPLVWKALGLFVGMLSFLFFWGVFDAVAIQMANDAAVHALAQVMQNNLAFDAIINMPEGAIKSLGIFGKARGVGFAMAGACAGTLLTFGGAALSQIGGGFMSNAEHKGEDAARKTALPEERGALVQSMVTGNATESVVRQYGYMNTVSGQAKGMAESASWARQMNVNSGLSGGASRAAEVGGAIQAGSDLGRNIAMDNATGGTHDVNTMMLGNKDVTEFSVGKSYGSTVGEKTVADGHGLNSDQYGEWVGGLGAAKPMVERDASALLHGGSKAFSDENVSDLALQEKSELMGRIKAEPGATASDKINSDISAVEQQNRERLGRGGWMAHHPGAAEDAGRGSAIQSTAHGEAVIAAAGQVGVHGISQGDELRILEHANQGMDASHLDGGIAGTAARVGEAHLASQVANANVMQAAASVLGKDPNSIQGLIAAKTEQGKTSMVVPLTSDTKGRLIDYAEQHLHMAKETADALRQQDSNGSAAVTLNDAGDIESIRFDAGNTASVRQSTVLDSSTRRDYSDTTNFQRGPQGGLGLLDGDNLSTQLQKAYQGSGYGVANQVQMDATVAQVSEALSAKGVRIDASDAHKHADVVSGGGKIGLGVGVPGTKLGVGGDISGRTQSSDETSTSTNINGNTALARDIIMRSREHAIQDVGWSHGAAFIQDPARADEASVAISKRQQELVVEAVNHYAQVANEKGTKEIEENNTVGRERVYDRDVQDGMTPENVERKVKSELAREPKI